MEKMIYYDMLTQLLNRRGLKKWFNETNLESNNQKLALILFDFNNFKLINDRYGHAVGDLIIEVVADRIQKNFNGIAACARLGGDQFVLMCNNCNEIRALEIAKELNVIIEEPIIHKNIQHNIKNSMGVVLFPEHTNELKKALIYADIAMYEAKKNSKSNIGLFEQDMYAKYKRQIEFYSEVKNAVQNKAFKVWFQPMFIMETHKICGAEALVRWVNNQGKCVGPNEFLTVATNLGLMSEIDEIVLENTCETVKWWQEKYNWYCPVSVNLSMQSVLDNQLVSRISTILQKTQLGPQYLMLELTEHESISDMQQVKETFLKLKEIGVSIALDDFGQGYSNFDCLCELPIDIVKIDKSIIDKVNTSERNANILKHICNMEEALMMTTIVEGVEDEAQIETMRQLQLQGLMVQGYYYSKPLSKEKFEKLLV